MKDPYEVLEIGRNASQEEIKAAYKRLVKQYHPDKYRNNPLADLAEEKLKEVNEAYESLSGQQGAQSSSYGYDNNSYQAEYAGSQFDEARQYINMGNLQAAEAVLNKSKNRNAEWFYLRGIICQRKGWHDDAVSNIQQAVNMDPNNYEYQRTLSGMVNQGGMYRNTAYGRGYQNGNDALCQMLQCYCCADMCCDCF